MWGPRNAYEESAPGTGSAAPLHPDAVRQNLAHRIAMAGIVVDGFDHVARPGGVGAVQAIADGTVTLRCALEGDAPPRPAIDLLLALPRPKVMRRLCAQIAARGQSLAARSRLSLRQVVKQLQNVREHTHRGDIGSGARSLDHQRRA